MKRQRVFKIVSNILFGIGGAIAVYAIASIFITRASLPPGVCPIDNSRPLLYIAIGLLGMSFITSVIADRKNKTSKESN